MGVPCHLWLLCWDIRLLKLYSRKCLMESLLLCFALQDQCTLTEHSLSFSFSPLATLAKQGALAAFLALLSIHVCLCTLVRKVTRGHKIVTSELSKHLLSCMRVSVCGNSRLCVAIWQIGLTYSALNVHRPIVFQLIHWHENNWTKNKRNQNERENWGLIVSVAQSLS